jgi:dimethylargininase
MLLALTHIVPSNTARAEITFIERKPINQELAQHQHAAYCQTLERHGLSVKQLSANAQHPDACFVEDAAVVLDELAVITRMGAESRRAEVQAIAQALAPHRELAHIHPPATLEGGDVLRIGKKVYVGLSRRTNAEGIGALTSILNPRGYEVIPVEVNGCLHLKTACTALDEETLLLNRAYVTPETFKGYKLLFVPESEPLAANALRLGETILLAASFPKTLELLARQQPQVETLDISEFQKMEAGLTCLSLLFHVKTSLNMYQY